MNNDWLKASYKEQEPKVHTDIQDPNIHMNEQEPKANNQERVYEVKKGDSLSQIGKALNVNWRDLAKKNNIKSPYVIRIGQKLKY